MERGERNEAGKIPTPQHVEGTELEEKKKSAFCNYQSKDWIRGELSKDPKSRGILTRSSIYARS